MEEHNVFYDSPTPKPPYILYYIVTSILQRLSLVNRKARIFCNHLCRQTVSLHLFGNLQLTLPLPLLHPFRQTFRPTFCSTFLFTKVHSTRMASQNLS